MGSVAQGTWFAIDNGKDLISPLRVVYYCSMNTLKEEKMSNRKKHHGQQGIL